MGSTGERSSTGVESQILGGGASSPNYHSTLICAFHLFQGNKVNEKEEKSKGDVAIKAVLRVRGWGRGRSQRGVESKESHRWETFGVANSWTGEGGQLPVICRRQ